MSRTAIENIEVISDDLTNVEKIISEFFLNDETETDFSAKNIANQLYVSEASLSRFAQKCGYRGYREFIYHYESERSTRKKQLNTQTQNVFSAYQTLLDRTYSIVNESQLYRIAGQLSNVAKVYVYGMGYSGIAAQEIKLRFMRLGLNIEAINDPHIMNMNSAIVQPDSLILGVSLSGRTKEVLSSIALAKSRGIKVFLVTSNQTKDFREDCDEIIAIASLDNLQSGSIISPQFPILVFFDIFYTYYLNTDFYHKSALHNSTLTALDWNDHQ